LVDGGCLVITYKAGKQQFIINNHVGVVDDRYLAVVPDARAVLDDRTLESNGLKTQYNTDSLHIDRTTMNWETGTDGSVRILNKAGLDYESRLNCATEDESCLFDKTG